MEFRYLTPRAKTESLRNVPRPSMKSGQLTCIARGVLLHDSVLRAEDLRIQVVLFLLTLGQDFVSDQPVFLEHIVPNRVHVFLSGPFPLLRFQPRR